MIWVDTIRDLEFYNPNPVWGCYADTVFEPSDIILQAQLGTDFDYTSISAPDIKICKPDGSFIESGNSYFHLNITSFYLNGITYYYANALCHTLTPGMISNGCFVLELIVTNTLAPFDKFTQKYVLNDPAFIVPSGITITTAGTGATNLATLCVIPQPPNGCRKTFVKLVSFCDCIDSFNGDFFGDGVIVVSTTVITWTFARLSWINGRLKTLIDDIKRTISINNRTQRTEKTSKYQLQSDTVFPEWKMKEIEGMLLANHIFVNDTQLQSEGGQAFSQFGVPQSCHYAYKLELELQEPFEWQVYGCTPPCAALTYYYPITF